MNFKVSKTYYPTHEIPRFIQSLLLIIFIPFILVIILFGLLGSYLSHIKSLIFKNSSKQNVSISSVKNCGYLLEREDIKIALLEDYNDEEFSNVADLWCDQVYDEDNFIYRAVTEPFIEGIENEFITSFIKETETGAFIQILDKYKLEKESIIETKLSFINYSDLKVHNIESIGPFYLYFDKKKPELIRGFNRDGDLELIVTQKNGM